jgi:NADPH-dependent 2,4-dienoyl-CoA reductase/sulfur reductase-like enzyme
VPGPPERFGQVEQGRTAPDDDHQRARAGSTGRSAVTGAVAVVGAGLAGLGAVRALRGQGYSGRIVLIGQEPHAPYDRPPLSKAFLEGAMTPAELSLAAPEDADLDVEVRLNTTAVALHPEQRSVELGDGERVGGDGVVIATGARARRLPGAPSGVHTLRTLDDALALRPALLPGARLVVVGAGFIGAEVASVAHGIGLQVTVVEAAPVPLAGLLGEQLGAVCARLHTDHGVGLITGVPVEALLDAGGTLRAVRLADGRELPTDQAVVGVGSAPNVEWLAGSGLRTAGGVATDADGATAAPGVVATGDCALRYEPAARAAVRQEHWTNALQHPQFAVASLLGGPRPPQTAAATVPYFWSDQYGVRLQFAGVRAPGDTVDLVEGDLDSRRFVAVYRRRGTPVAVLSLSSPRTFVRWRRELATTLPTLAG